MRPKMNPRRLKYAFCVYALCPLVFVETAWSGHVDVLALMPLIVSLLLLLRAPSKSAVILGGALFGISIAAKFLGVLAVPLILFAKRSPLEPTLAAAMRRRLTFLATAAALVAASYLPYLDAGPQLFSGFGTYASTWQSNAGPFRLAGELSETSLKRWAPPADTRRFTRTDDKLILRFPRYDELARRYGFTRIWQGRPVPATSFAANQIAHTLAKLLAVMAVALAMLWAIVVRRELIAGMLIVLFALFFVAPVVHPWYVAWLLPFAALRRSPPALVFAPAVLIAYLAWLNARAGGPWQVTAWAAVVEFGAVGLVAWWWAGRDFSPRPAMREARETAEKPGQHGA
jgi:hypothetical protein